jgi:hypothetical protein
MKHLEELLKKKNWWSLQYEIVTAEGRQQVAEMIDTDISPENLTCDGELPRSEVNRRYNLLVRAAKELKAIDPNVKFIELDL